MKKFNNEVLVQSILHAMQAEIESHGLELMSRYPDDLVVHDKAQLLNIAVPGATIAWMVGHSHTHMIPIGIHKKQSELVGCFINLANDDLFYTITIKNNKFKMVKVDREEFADLKTKNHPYEKEGGISSFWLMNGKNHVGFININHVGTIQKKKVLATINPCRGISDLDYVALNVWCTQSIIEFANTLFIESEIVWKETI